MKTFGVKAFKKLARKLKYNGAAIARRTGRTRQAANARLRRLGLSK